jgi:ADP-ribose pyrophosphatase
MPKIETLETPFRGRLFSVDILRVRTETGINLRREVVRHPAAVTVVPLLAVGGGGPAQVVLIRNFRAAANEHLWELPAGKLEPGEAPASAAARELEEETGYRAGRLRPLGRFFTTPGFSDELMHVFVAEELVAVGQRLEPGEMIEVAPRSTDAVERMIADGVIMDGKSLAALLLYHHAMKAEHPRVTTEDDRS